MDQDVYQLTPQEAQFYHVSNHSRFLTLLNEGISAPIRLYVCNQVQNDEAPCCFVAVHGVSKGQEILFHQDWIRARIRCITSILRAEQILMQMLPSRIVSQIMYLHSTSQFSPLRKILKHLQNKFKTDPKESCRFASMINDFEHRRRFQDTKHRDLDGDVFNETEFKTLVYTPNNILSMEKLRLSAHVREEVHWFVEKYKHRQKLTAAGLPLGNRLLLAGPPGNGKTALAGALSQLLSLPFFVVNMSALRQSPIGGTGHQISSLFQGLMQSSRLNNGSAIVFFDECDSIATTRIYEQGADKEDSAALNVLLTNLDQLNSETIVVAATNNPDELDPAFKRRFSSYLWLAPPNLKAIQKYVEDYQQKHKIHFSEKELDQVCALSGMSWAKVTEFCQSLHMAQVIGVSYHKHIMGWRGKDSNQNAIGFRVYR